MILWRVFLVSDSGDLYLGAVRANDEQAALAAARERWLADDPLPWQFAPSRQLRVERA